MEQQKTIFRFPIDALNHEHKIPNNDDDGTLCGLVLAGGKGKRLRPFIRSLGKGTLPKIEKVMASSVNDNENVAQ